MSHAPSHLRLRNQLSPPHTSDSILLHEYKAGWTKLINLDPFVELHRRFWIQGESGHILLNPLEPEYKGDGDDDIGPGCHVLDIGILTLGPTKLWIRNEYIRLYKHCEDHLESKRDKSKSPSVVVTGQPGIGKSYWMYYVLCRRLAEKKPVLWYRGPSLYLFVSDGVYMSPSNLSSASFRTRVWTLVDADNEISFPPVLSQPGTNNLIIFVTSPDQQRWAGLEKTTTWKVAFMNPWTRREISEAAPIHGFAGNDAIIDEMYNRYGPTARICFELSEEESHLNKHRAQFDAALSSLSSRALQGMVDGLFKVDSPYSILLLKRLPGADWSLSTVEIITQAAKVMVQDQLSRETQAQLLELYHSLARVELSKCLADVVQEALAQKLCRRTF